MILLLALLLLLPVGHASAGYLGLHHTDEEVAIWRNRRTQTSPLDYASMWNAVITRANAAVGSRFVGNTTGSCLPSDWAADDDGGISRTKDIGLTSAGLVWAVNGTTSHRDKVRDALLNQAAQSGTNFANRSQWCANTSAPYHNLFHWLARITNAYSYIRASISSGQRATLDDWFLGAGDWLRDAFNEQVRQRFSGYASGNYTCTGIYCPGASQGRSHFGGPEIFAFGRGWDNIFVSAATGGCAIGVLLDNASIKSDCIRYVQEWVRYATYPGGQIYDQHRWNVSPIAASRGYFYPATNLGSIIEVADHLARAGDSTLYDYTSSSGQFGTDGGTKGILNAVLHIARQTNNTIQEYASTTATTDPSLKIDHLTNINRIDFINLLPANLYYNNSEVNTATHTDFPSPISCGAYDCTLGAWGQYGADLRFLFMDTGADPYTGSPEPLTPSIRLCYVDQALPGEVKVLYNNPNAGTFSGTTGFTARLNTASNAITGVQTSATYMGVEGSTLTLTTPIADGDDLVDISYTPGTVTDGSQPLAAASNFACVNLWDMPLNIENALSHTTPEVGRPLSALFDGDHLNEASSWVVSAAPPVTMQAVWDLGPGTTIAFTSVTYGPDNAGSKQCETIQLESSANGSSWSNVVGPVSCNFPRTDGLRTATFGSTSARYWRLTVVDDRVGVSTGAQLMELQASTGSPPPPAQVGSADNLAILGVAVFGVSAR